MSKKQTEPVALKRQPKRRRRFPWWIIPLIPAVLAVGYVAYLRIKQYIRTLPPPLPPEIQAQDGTEGILYQTDFESEALAGEWEIFSDGLVSAALADAQLVVDVNAPTDTGAWSGLNYTFDDFVLDVDATKLGGPDDNGIIIIFRLQDKNNYNRFDISSDGYYALSVARAGEYRVISDYNRSQAIRLGNATNHIRIWATGDVFRFEVNDALLRLCVSNDPNVQPLWDLAATEPTCLGGTVVESWQNDDLLRGKIGLGAQGFSGFDGVQSTPALATIGFDNLTIWSPDAPVLQP